MMDTMPFSPRCRYATPLRYFRCRHCAIFRRLIIALFFADYAITPLFFAAISPLPPLPAICRQMPLMLRCRRRAYAIICCCRRGDYAAAEFHADDITLIIAD